MKRKYLGLAMFFALAFTFASCSDDDDLSVSDDNVIISDDQAPATVTADGFYILNEGWFGNDKGSITFFNNNGSINYNVYTSANPGETLGITSQYATIYGDNLYAISLDGNKLVVANANTLKRKADIQNIGSGNARSFVGVDSNRGYISTNSGVYLFDINELKVGASIAGISGEVVNMCLVGDYVFAATISKGIYIINTANNALNADKSLIEGNFNSVVRSKDGSVWAGAGDKLVKIDPYTFKTTVISLAGTQIAYSWNAGSLCASTQQNVLYWKDGAKIAKYDINNQTLNPDFYTLGKDDNSNQLYFYGVGLRVDPLTDKLVLTSTTNVWGNNINIVQLITSQGNLDKTISVKGGADNSDYYWFPAMPFFKDVNAPAILTNQIILKPNERKAISLNNMVVDADNASSSIIKKLLTTAVESDIVQYKLQQDSLIITSSAHTGKLSLTLHANSNGRIVEKGIRIDVR